MHTKKRNLICLILSICILMQISTVSVFAVSKESVQETVEKTAAYVYETVKKPQVGSIGGEWAILGLARSGYTVPDSYYSTYYATVEKYVKSCDGVLHAKKYTEYSRVILALTSIGFDPTSVAGYDLTLALGDFEKTIWQGINGPIFALIALDSGNYEIPQNPNAETQATRELYIDEILKRQLSDGGFSLTGGTTSTSAGDEKADPDITGMALQALAKYQAQPKVQEAIQRALTCLSSMQHADGGFSTYGVANLESTAQVLVALCELGIAIEDPRFVKNGFTVLDHILSFQTADHSFLHTKSGSGSNQMATEQALYSLVAAKRALEGKKSLYRMSDALNISGKLPEGPGVGEGLAGKHADVKSMPITAPGKTFEDISGHVYQPAIEALSARGIIHGKTDNAFAPNDTMTRAEFAAIVTRSLGLEPKINQAFSDVAADAWYAGYIGTANAYGIVNGTSANQFTPEGVITREEAAVMIARAAVLCGLKVDVDAAFVRDMLAQFDDYVLVSDWAKESLAFCYDSEILSSKEMNILPQQHILRSEISEMLFRMLGNANLL